MRRRLILGLLVLAIAAHGVAGCTWREFIHAGPPAAAAGAKGFATGGPVGGIIAIVSSLLLGGAGARHVERRRMKRQHTTDRAGDRARIAELERRLAAATQHPPGA